MGKKIIIPLILLGILSGCAEPEIEFEETDTAVETSTQFTEDTQTQAFTETTVRENPEDTAAEDTTVTAPPASEAAIRKTAEDTTVTAPSEETTLSQESAPESEDDWKLELFIEKKELTEGEPLSAYAELTYTGSQEEITVEGSYELIHFNIEGSEYFSSEQGLAAVPGISVEHTVKRGETVRCSYSGNCVWSADDPNADFYENFHNDMILPAGSCTLTAYTDFFTPEKNSIRKSVSEDITVLPEESSWDKAYTDLLREYESEDTQLCAFDLYDMDNDGIPELFLSRGNFHAAGVQIYTYSECETIMLQCADDEGYEYGSWGVVHLGGDVLWSCYSGMGAAYSSYYIKEGNALIKVLETFHQKYNDDREDIYKVNGMEVTQEEYMNAEKDYVSADFTDMGRGHIVTEENIVLVFSQRE